MWTGGCGLHFMLCTKLEWSQVIDLDVYAQHDFSLKQTQPNTHIYIYIHPPIVTWTLVNLLYGFKINFGHLLYLCVLIKILNPQRHHQLDHINRLGFSFLISLIMKIPSPLHRLLGRCFAGMDYRLSQRFVLPNTRLPTPA